MVYDVFIVFYRCIYVHAKVFLEIILILVIYKVNLFIIESIGLTLSVSNFFQVVLNLYKCLIHFLPLSNY